MSVDRSELAQIRATEPPIIIPSDTPEQIEAAIRLIYLLQDIKRKKLAKAS